MVLGLSGCFKASQDVKVKADGTGTVVLHVELDKRALAAVARSFGGSPPDLGAAQFQLVDRTFPDGTRVRTGDDAERSVLDASFDFDGSDDYLRKMEQINEAIAPGSDEPTPSGSLEVRRVGEQLEVALDLGDGREDLDAFDLGRLIGVLSADTRPSATVTITMPGPILATNGTATGRTATWDLLASGAPSTLTVSSDIARAGLPGWVVPAAAGLMLALILGIVGVLLSRRAQRPGEAVVPVQPAPAQPAPLPGTFFPAPPPGPPPAGPTDRPLEPQPSAQPGTLVPARPPGWPSRGPEDVPTPPPWAPQPQPWAATEPVDPAPTGAEAAPPPVPAWPGVDPVPPPVPAWPGVDPAPPAPVSSQAGSDAGPRPVPSRPGADPPPPAPAPPPGPVEDGPHPPGPIWQSRPPGPPSSAGAAPPADPRPWRVSPEAAAHEATAGPPAPEAATPKPLTPGPVTPERAGSAAPVPAPEASAPAEPARPDSQRSTPAASPDEAAAVATGPAAGWYPDPAGGGGVRYWDGASWTHHTH